MEHFFVEDFFFFFYKKKILKSSVPRKSYGGVLLLLLLKGLPCVDLSLRVLLYITHILRVFFTMKTLRAHIPRRHSEDFLYLWGSSLPRGIFWISFIHYRTIGGLSSMECHLTFFCTYKLPCGGFL